jgi:hypothetical protein
MDQVVLVEAKMSSEKKYRWCTRHSRWLRRLEIIFKTRITGGTALDRPAGGYK